MSERLTACKECIFLDQEGCRFEYSSKFTIQALVTNPDMGEECGHKEELANRMHIVTKEVNPPKRKKERIRRHVEKPTDLDLQIEEKTIDRVMQRVQRPEMFFPLADAIRERKKYPAYMSEDQKTEFEESLQQIFETRNCNSTAQKSVRERITEIENLSKHKGQNTY